HDACECGHLQGRVQHRPGRHPYVEDVEVVVGARLVVRLFWMVRSMPGRSFRARCRNPFSSVTSSTLRAGGEPVTRKAALSIASASPGVISASTTWVPGAIPVQVTSLVELP